MNPCSCACVKYSKPGGGVKFGIVFMGGAVLVVGVLARILSGCSIGGG